MLFMRRRGEEEWGRAVEAYLAVQRPTTQRQYASIFLDWTKHLGSRSPLKATEVDALKFARAQSERASPFGTVSAATVHRKLVVLKALYSLLHQSGHTKSNPFAQVSRSFSAQTGERRPTELIPFDHVERLLQAPSAATKEGQRDRCFVALLLGCALRVGEAEGLRVGDVRTTKAGDLYLHLRNTKNGTSPDQPVPPSIAAAVRAYVEVRQAEGARATDPLLVMYLKDELTPKPAGITSRQLRRIFARYIKELKIPGRYSPHSARATAITWLLEQGVPHREVRKFSRHSSVQMVERYDKLRDAGAEDVAAIIDYKKK